MSTKTIQDKLILVRLTINQWGSRKYDRKASEDVAKANGAADAREVGRFNKMLVDPLTILPVHQSFTELRNRHAYLTAPWSDDGVRVLPAPLYFDYQAKMREARAASDAAVAHFIDVDYPVEIANASKRLGALFRAADYPSQKEIASRFSVEIRYEPLPNPDDVRVWGIGDVAAEQIQREVRANLESTIAAAHQSVVDDVLARANEFVEKIRHYDEKLVEAAKNADGKRAPGLRETALGNLRDLVAVVGKGLNVSGDAKLSKFAAEIEKSIAGVSIEQLRAAAALRRAKAAEVDAIAAKFAGVFKARPVAAGGAR